MSRGASLRAGREVLEEAVVLVGVVEEEGSWRACLTRMDWSLCGGGSREREGRGRGERERELKEKKRTGGLVGEHRQLVLMALRASRSGQEACTKGEEEGGERRTFSLKRQWGFLSRINACSFLTPSSGCVFLSSTRIATISSSGGERSVGRSVVEVDEEGASVDIFAKAAGRERRRESAISFT